MRIFGPIFGSRAGGDGARLGLTIGWAVALGLPAAAVDGPRLNQIQVIGSHNSYHIVPAPAIMHLIEASGRHRSDGVAYTHPPFADQFSRQGVRQIELDVFADPKGGLYARPHARTLLRAQKQDPGPDPNVDGRLDKPGLKILHVPDVDFQTRAATFVDALREVHAWSKAHPRHVPILVLVELKDGGLPFLPTRPPKFDKDALARLEAEILSVFDRSEILAPDRVRGQRETLREAVTKDGWPLLDSVRGVVMFALDNESKVRDDYIEGHPSLRGRLMFASVAPDRPEAAWFKINDPVRHFDQIQKAVRDGFLVRTRADANTTQSRNNDVRQRDKALASGAQFVSTDYAEPDRRFSEYSVRLPGNVVARSNPISGDRAWDGLDLESGKPPGPVKPAERPAAQ